MNETDKIVEPWARISIGVALMLVPVALLVLLFGIWPDQLGGAGAGDPKGYAAVLGTTWNPTLEGRLMLIVVTCGALGSYIHAATSFATYVGNAQLHKTWVWWYLLRPFLGGVLAFVLYAVTRGGLLTQGGGASVLNPFGVAAVAGMTGMFSKQAVDKLQEIFDSLFKTAVGGGDDERTGKLTGGGAGPPGTAKAGGAVGVNAATAVATGESPGNSSVTVSATAAARQVTVPPAIAATLADGGKDGGAPSLQQTGT